MGFIINIKKHLADPDVVIGEVIFLLWYGYRKEDQQQIMEGLRVMQRDYGYEEWRRLETLELRYVIEEMFAMGVP